MSKYYTLESAIEGACKYRASSDFWNLMGFQPSDFRPDVEASVSRLQKRGFPEQVIMDYIEALEFTYPFRRQDETPFCELPVGLRRVLRFGYKTLGLHSLDEAEKKFGGVQ